MSESNYEYQPAGSDQSEADLLLLWQDRFCDPLTIGIISWAANITDPAHGSATSTALYQGWQGTGFQTVTIPADAFTGSFGETIIEGLREDETPEVVWFTPVEMAAGSCLLPFNPDTGEQATPGVGIKVVVVATSDTLNAVTKLSTREERKATVGWVIPDRVPHALGAEDFVRALKGHWGGLRRFRSSQVERTEVVLSEEQAMDFASRLA